MRQIVLDTETTGIGHENGHRVIEIGCLELIDRRLTGNEYHVYLNPDRPIEQGAFRVHGISTEFLQNKPRFKDIADDFMLFITGAELIIHNAPFDVGFLNSELNHAKFKTTIEAHCEIFDTLVLARQKHPGQRNNLDALCKRYNINNSNRQLHGALLDAELLAFVYLAMTGGQINFLMEDVQDKSTQAGLKKETAELSSISPVIMATIDEIALHNEFVKFIEKKSGKNLFV